MITKSHSGIGLPITEEPSHTTVRTDHVYGGSADQEAQFPGRYNPLMTKQCSGIAMATHLTLLMRQYFFRALPQVTACSWSIPCFFRFRTLVRGYFHCFQTKQRSRLMIQVFNALRMYRASINRQQFHHPLMYRFSSLITCLKLLPLLRLVRCRTLCLKRSIDFLGTGKYCIDKSNQ